MREFNLEEAKAGKPVCTRDGRNARIICFDRKNPNCYPLVVLIEYPNKGEAIRNYTYKGKTLDANDTQGADLMMKTEKHEGWGWVSHNNIVSIFAQIYDTEEEALSHKPDRCEPFLAKVEWEE